VDPSKPFVGKVWPGPAAYVDWLHKDAEQYWMDEMKTFAEKLKIDGLWIDMNEASNF
jgi:alpha-glucosidase (family GH31 glycosyl hydrolase)